VESEQYEELCRLFLAEKFGIPVEKILSGHVPNPQRPGLPEYKHQIDLHWEIENELSTYFHIANAKWRGSDKVKQPEVLLLQQVKQKVAAHKALMITSRGFTAGAKAVARDEGIALHIVTPAIEVASLPTGDRAQIQRTLQDLAASSSKPIYSNTVEYRALDEPNIQPQQRPSSSERPVARPQSYETRVVTGQPTRVGGGYSTRGGAPPTGGSQTRGGGITRGGTPGRQR
jgi:hypothetical protein